ncbi:hypothetical protein EDD16DRAFT_1515695 [Pisolithus croceorrhizus]|nr:hypothetical protein EDD16DRAFT_1515695 [Pisolithus croceorrhizus]
MQTYLALQYKMTMLQIDHLHYLNMCLMVIKEKVCWDWEHEAMSAEFVGPGSKLYCNYHLGLNTQKCDVCGQFLPDDAPPPQCAEKAQDDWIPYCNQLEFELANFLFTHAEMPAKKIDVLLDIWATSLLGLGGQPPFMNHADLYSVIDVAGARGARN